MNTRMQHHVYPLPPPETLAWIEESRRRGLPEEEIRAELSRRGMEVAAIDAALAPGATVVGLAESSVEKIPLTGFRWMLVFGVILGFLPTYLTARANSVALRGQDRFLHESKAYLLAIAVAYLAVIGAAFHFAIVGDRSAVYLALGAYFLTNALSCSLFIAMVRRIQSPFRADAESRDELAPAGVMTYALIGLLDTILIFGAPLVILRLVGA